ncbi:MAG: GNAT family N-acetyltransferase [bacterium]|nr:GNAT family N-acetyltransferase [bacterium]
MEAVLRAYSPETDFDDVFALAREVISEPPYEDARRELLAYPQREMLASVAMDSSGTLIGFCAATHAYWNAIAMIDYIVVAPDCRSQGVGGQLVTAIEAGLRESDIRIVCVHTAAWNKAGIRFYEKQGFVVRACFAAYFGRGNDLVWLDRSLL